MTRATNRLLRVTLAVAVGIVCFLVNGDLWLTKSGSLITEAYAIIGRPLTPLSYAGVARRTTCRAIAVGVAVGAAAAASRCVQAVDAYGRIYTRCY